MKHKFILQPSLWVGEGSISLNMVEEELIFYTKWKVLKRDALDKIEAVQEIQIDGISENMRNELVFFDFTSKGFNVEMENVNVGKVVGVGVYDEKILAWEFKNNDLSFEGFETYYLQEDGTYILHAEYVTSDQFRTLIKGKIWIS